MSIAGEGLWQQIARPGPLRAAFRRAFRGNRRNPEACRFHLELEPSILALCDDLEHRRYAPAPYRFFHIRRPKRRLISVASFRDRVVHHALVAALEPLFEPRFIRHSYACRRGKGTHRALKQARRWARAFPYYLKTDVDNYFACIDHEVLLDLLAVVVETIVGKRGTEIVRSANRRLDTLRGFVGDLGRCIGKRTASSAIETPRKWTIVSTWGD